MNKDVKTLCEGCIACQKIGKQGNGLHHYNHCQLLTYHFQELQWILLDHFLEQNKGKNILVLMDYGTRWTEAKAVSAPTSRAAADMVLDICCRFGVQRKSLLIGVPFY